LATTLAVLDARTKRPGSGGRRGSARASRRVRCGSYFHQFKPICSALSTEQTRSRIRMVSSSTFASAIRTSPAITNPLSSTRSRISIRLVVPETVGLSMRVFLMARGRILGLPVLCQNDDAIGSSRKMSIPRPRHSVTDACKVGGRGGEGSLNRNIFSGLNSAPGGEASAICCDSMLDRHSHAFSPLLPALAPVFLSGDSSAPA
jgi:hypothetical protein